jgi:transcriptional regulator with XRE-family HTH domain
MTQVSKVSGAGGDFPPMGKLLRAKRELALAYARGERSALARVLASYPRHRAALIEFDAALVATSFMDEAVVAETAPLAERALDRALTAVFPPAASPVAARALSLKALRQARQVSMKDLAERLGLGVDVLSLLESGRIAAASIPARLVRALSEALGTATEQLTAAIQAQPALTPALQRSRAGARKEPVALSSLTFDEAVRLSPGMTTAQKASWLSGED